MSDTHLAALASVLLLSACVTAERQAAEAPACAAASFADDRFIGPAFTDKYNGRYANDALLLDVRREDRRLLIGPPQGPWRQLQRASAIPGDGAFRDGCGSSYHFILPPDGPGALLTITEPNGVRSEWHRD